MVINALHVPAHRLSTPLFPTFPVVVAVAVILILPERAKSVRAAAVGKGRVCSEADVLGISWTVASLLLHV